MSDGAPRGRTVISARAMERVVRAAAAEQFGVEMRSVAADLSDDGGGLSIALRTPVHVVPIGRLQDDPRAVERTGGSILDRAKHGETAITEQVGTITGSTVTRIAVRFTGAEIRRERRVR